MPSRAHTAAFGFAAIVVFILEQLLLELLPRSQILALLCLHLCCFVSVYLWKCPEVKGAPLCAGDREFVSLTSVGLEIPLN